MKFHGNYKSLCGKVKELQRFGGVCLTSYSLLKTRSDDLCGVKVGANFKWDYIVLDEGHQIKNDTTIVWKSVKLIPGKKRILLSGTPIQNRYEEIWSLFNFIDPALLGERSDFRKYVVKPIKEANRRGAPKILKDEAARLVKGLFRTISPYILRRVKKILDELGGTSAKASTEDHVEGRRNISKKYDLIVWVHLSEDQETKYGDYLASLPHLDIGAFAVIAKLRHLCSHSLLFQRDPSIILNNLTVDEIVQSSGKLKLLRQLLPKIHENNHRALIFADTYMILDFIEKIITSLVRRPVVRYPVKYLLRGKGSFGSTVQ